MAKEFKYTSLGQFPPERQPVLGWTDAKNWKVVRYTNGKWDTYFKVLAWIELPKAPPKPKVDK